MMRVTTAPHLIAADDDEPAPEGARLQLPAMSVAHQEVAAEGGDYLRVKRCYTHGR